MKTLFALLACIASAHAADPALPSFASAVAIEAAPGASHYSLTVPAPVYRALQRRDLGDLRIANGEGEFVPFAFASRGPVERKAGESLRLKLFPLYGDEARGMEGLDLRIEQTAAGTVVRLQSGTSAKPPPGKKLLGYLAEVPAEAKPAEALVLDWKSAESFTGSVRVETGDDLKRWSTLTSQAPVIQLAHAGERLERKRVELPGLRTAAARPTYLRISFLGVPRDFELGGVTYEMRGERPEPVRDSLVVTGKQDAEKRDEYAFDLGGSFPVDRVRLELPQANTVAPMQVFSRDKADGAWRLVTSTIAYRLNREGGEATSPPVPFGANADRYWLVRVDARSGGLGSGEVRLVASWVPHEVVFTARGTAPFSLVAGNRAAQPAALPLATILPGYREGEVPAATLAKLGEVRANTAAVAAPAGTIASAQAFAGTPEGRKWMLWSVLVAGVLFVGWMATRLMRDLGKAEGAAKKE
jgi:hypothetical protein